MPVAQIHHDFSPSRLYLRAKCPGSWAAEARTGDSEADSPEAARGRLLHAEMEKMMISPGYLPDANALSGYDAGLLQDCLEFVQSQARGLDSGAIHGAPEIRTEIPLTLSHWSGELTRGTADVVILPPPSAPVETSTATIIDYKFGRIPVGDAQARYQLAAYAAMVFEAFPKRFSRVLAYICQPTQEGWRDRAPLEFFDPATLKAGILRIICACRAPNAPCIPDADGHCRYCRAAAAGTCPAMAAALDGAQKGAAALEAGGLDLAAIDGAGLAEIIARGRLAARLLEAAEKEMRARLEKSPGAEISGWRLESRPGRRRVDSLKCAEAIAGLIPRDEFPEFCSVKLGELLDECGARLKERGEAKSEKAGRMLALDLMGDAVQEGAPTILLKHND